MKAVNFFSRIFCSGATMKARVKFDELVNKYSSMTSEEIEALIKNTSDEYNKRWPSLNNSTFEFETHSFANEPLPRDDDGHFYPTDNHKVFVCGPWFKTKNHKKYHYLAVDRRITGIGGCQKVKEIVYKIEIV